MKKLLAEIRACEVCAKVLPHEPRPVVRASGKSRILIVGQAPGSRVHNTGVPWNDPSGVKLREWLGVDDDTFYNPDLFALVPMGFCYPGTGKSGDLPPRPECAPLWQERLLKAMPDIKLTLLVGQYAQKHYLGASFRKNLTETVRDFEHFLPDYFPTPHPSPRNRIWLRRNPWFEKDLIPVLKELVKDILADQ
ncbi:hypothetical protein FUAX_11550 [Fulvitalea axinellae]|uniref:Uracil-DNA glycosylase-like domain-containing protein n=1 Tax=Fulvitalea axinellae TaxID=1182444 RepID=A0AAU9CYJ1_9BACT|nr:hypothetical protein FUAX_11550 [Fulvitalea axinellae]